MGLLDVFKGDAQRQQEAAQRLEAEKQAQLDRQIEQDKKLAAQQKQAKELETDRAKLSGQRLEQPGPAQRMIPEHGDRIREAAANWDKKAEQVQAQEASRMEYQPAGMQRGPSLGGPGTSFVNTRAVQVRESYLDRLEREQREKGQTLADLLPQKERDRQQQQGQEQDSGLSLGHDLGH